MYLTGLSAPLSAYAAASPAATGRRSPAAGSTGPAPAAPSLTPDELRQVDKLKARDREVRQHELAHLSVGAGLITAGASYTYQKGPDGINYAIGGEVGINTAPGRTPEETLLRARQIRAAALAPAHPSGQDLAVAAQATQMEQQARIEQAQQTEDKASLPPDRQAAVQQAYTAGASERSSFSAYA